MPDQSEQPKISNRKLNANRANAQKSTGPRTAEGKAASSQNRAAKLPYEPDPDFNLADYAPDAFLHSTLLLGESHDEFALLHQQFLHDYKPLCQTEILLIEQMSANHWHIRRLQAGRLYLLRNVMLTATQGPKSERHVKVVSQVASSRSFEAMDRALGRAHRLRSQLVKDLEFGRRVFRQRTTTPTCHSPFGAPPHQLLPVQVPVPTIAERNTRPILDFPRPSYAILPVTSPIQPLFVPDDKNRNP